MNFFKLAKDKKFRMVNCHHNAISGVFSELHIYPSKERKREAISQWKIFKERKLAIWVLYFSGLKFGCCFSWFWEKDFFQIDLHSQPQKTELFLLKFKGVVIANNLGQKSSKSFFQGKCCNRDDWERTWIVRGDVSAWFLMVHSEKMDFLQEFLKFLEGRKMRSKFYYLCLKWKNEKKCINLWEISEALPFFEKYLRDNNCGKSSFEISEIWRKSEERLRLTASLQCFFEIFWAWLSMKYDFQKRKTSQKMKISEKKGNVN